MLSTLEGLQSTFRLFVFSLKLLVATSWLICSGWYEADLENYGQMHQMYTWEDAVKRLEEGSVGSFGRRVVKQLHSLSQEPLKYLN